MRIVVALGAAALLAGCVPPEPMPTAYAPMQPYRLLPEYRRPPPSPAFSQPPLAEPLPLPNAPSFTDAPPAPNPAPPPASDDSGALPLNALPPPAPETPSAGNTSPTSPAGSGDTTPTAQKPTPTAGGRGSNVPLEGFRPLHGVSRPTP